MASSPAKKKRKTNAGLRILEDAERCEIKLTPTECEEGGPWKDKELWLFRLPKECDPKSLDQQKIQMDTSTEIIQENNIYKVESYPVDQQDNCLNNYLILSPSPSAGKLQLGPPLEGHMSVVKSVNVPTVKAPVPNTEPKVHNPHGLKRRWKPFGFKKPHDC